VNTLAIGATLGVSLLSGLLVLVPTTNAVGATPTHVDPTVGEAGTGMPPLPVVVPKTTSAKAIALRWSDVGPGDAWARPAINFVGKDHVTPVEYNFAFDKLRYSTGLAVQWLAPLGVFRFSYAIPLNKEDGTRVLYGDETEGFQFSIGQAF